MFIQIFIHGINITNNISKMDIGYKTIKPVLRLEESNFLYDTQEISELYKANNTFININPKTGLAWSKNDLIAVELGIKLES
jgi:hypothetical protein